MNTPKSGTPRKGKTALVLAGGGARAAYQAGVLLAIRDLQRDPRKNPFSILCGTSAGAINAVALACNADNFDQATEILAKVWRNISVNQVYRADALGILRSGVGCLGALLFGGWFRTAPRSLLDNTPLHHLLEKWLDFDNLTRAISDGSLYAVSLTASGYTSGESVSFFQARPDVETWQRTHRFGCRTRLTLDHVIASSAIPLIFPAVHVNREFFGDGSMRQLAPLSPAIHLGAEKLLIIGAGRLFEKSLRQRSTTYPTFAQIAGHALSSIFLDGLAVDIERMQRINRTLATIPEEARQAAGITLRPIESLVISPSEPLDTLASRHVKSLPAPVRFLLGGIGAMNRRGSALASYLLFESQYTSALIDLGYKDTLAIREQVSAFLAE